MIRAEKWGKLGSSVHNFTIPVIFLLIVVPFYLEQSPGDRVQRARDQPPLSAEVDKSLRISAEITLLRKKRKKMKSRTREMESGRISLATMRGESC